MTRSTKRRRDTRTTTGAPSDPDPRPTPALTRRRFVRLLAAGATAALAAPALAGAAPAGRARPSARATAAPPSPRVAKGLAEARDSLAKTLKTLRDYELPTGSEQGFAFRPLGPRRKP